MSAMTFARAQAKWDNMLPFDDSREEMAFESRCEEIENDSERLLEAVIDESDSEANERLAELRIVLSNSVYLLGLIAMGDSIDDVLRSTDRAIAFRALIRAADDADALVGERVKLAAEDAA